MAGVVKKKMAEKMAEKMRKRRATQRDDQERSEKKQESEPVAEDQPTIESSDAVLAFQPESPKLPSSGPRIQQQIVNDPAKLPVLNTSVVMISQAPSASDRFTRLQTSIFVLFKCGLADGIAALGKRCDSIQVENARVARQPGLGIVLEQRVEQRED